MRQSVERAVTDITFQLALLERLFQEYESLLERTRQRAPDLVETTALGSVLHSFYNGLEGIFLIVAKRVDEDELQGSQWHRDLKARMAEAYPGRPAVISHELSDLLDAYMAFRHFYRHSYSFFLDWAELQKLVTPLVDVWARARDEISRFLGSLAANGGDMPPGRG